MSQLNARRKIQQGIVLKSPLAAGNQFDSLMQESYLSNFKVENVNANDDVRQRYKSGTVTATATSINIPGLFSRKLMTIDQEKQ